MERQNDETELRVTQRVPKRLPLPSTSAPPIIPAEEVEEEKKSWLSTKLHNKQRGTYLGRTPHSWAYILSYSIMYLVFLATFTMIFLYGSLHIVKQTTHYSLDKMELLTYSQNGIGLSAAPTSETNYPLIWYKNGETEDFDKYVQALDKLLSKNRRKRGVSPLGPCGQSPYGYGEKPCVIIRINKQLKWRGQPLRFNSTIAKTAPAEVQAWMRGDTNKLWLQCGGYHSYDKEHIGAINYYPDPPGFDVNEFPLDGDKLSPLIAVQISDFTIGISLAIECKLWYDGGPSTINFILYVAPEDKIAYSSVNV